VSPGEREAAAATRLIEAAASGTPCTPVRDLLDDVDAAYRVQQAIAGQRVDLGARVVGRKIGLTSPAVQRQLGVAAPDFGVLLDDMAHADRDPIALGGLLQPRVEAEVAFVLEQDLDADRPTTADVIGATGYVLPAIEVVDSRIEGWDIALVDTVADNASSGAFVLGSSPRLLHQVDLPDLGMVLLHHGQVVSTGAGAACLGSPVAAVVWLARTLAEQGSPLRAGEVVLSGALGPVVPVTAPGAFTARLCGLGQVTAVFTETRAA
jgi:2-keto-4-pentenoate hydratase